ncbi:MAG: GTP-binding protein [Planctomycetota bacterium]
MTRTGDNRVPTNVIVGFLGSGKTTAIANLIEQRPEDEDWSILINEFGMVSIDHALVESSLKGVAIEELGGGCACCTLALVFRPLLTQFLKRTKPHRLILEPSGVSHPANVIDVLRGPAFADSIELRNVICIIDPKDFEDTRWRETAVFQDQVQMADIVVINWTDCRNRELIDECRDWVDSFRPQKQLVLETTFGTIDLDLLDLEFETQRFPKFADAHQLPNEEQTKLTDLKLVTKSKTGDGDEHQNHEHGKHDDPKPEPGRPLRFLNDDPDYDACGWIFHVEDVFEREKLLDLLGYVHPIVRLKGVFRCTDDWWTINRAKDETSYATSAYRRDSRLEIILDRRTSGWDEFEFKLLECLQH